MKLSPFLLILIVPGILLGQATDALNSNDFRAIQEQQFVNIDSRGEIKLADVKGSPFVTKDYVDGKIIDDKKNIKIPVKLKYNAYLDKFLINLDSTEEHFSLPRLERYEYQYQGKRFFILIDKKLFKDTGNKYVQSLIDRPELKLYRQIRFRLDPGRAARNSYETSVPPSFEKDNRFFLKISDQPIKEMALERKDFAGNFPAKYRSKIKDFIYDRKLQFNTKSVYADVLLVLRYYLNLVVSD